MDQKIIDIFSANIEKINGCWLWTGELVNNIPSLKINGNKRYNSRRLSLDIVGKLLPTSEPVKPLVCNNKLCVNPDHLAQGNESRFWAHVHKLSEENGGCWVWTGHITHGGYGRHPIHRNGKEFGIRAHVYSWQLYTGRIVPVGHDILVCHKCDHRYCVNPDHLFLGTSQENSKDMKEKGRQSRGEKNGHAKLTEIQVGEIRSLYTREYTCIQLAELYGVTFSTISKIIRRQTWKHIL